MNYSGYAFKPNEKEMRDEIRELAPIALNKLKGKINIEKGSSHARVSFTATVDQDISDDVTEMDVLLYADNGNLCFGGDCTRVGTTNVFKGCYWTDQPTQAEITL